MTTHYRITSKRHIREHVVEQKGWFGWYRIHSQFRHFTTFEKALNYLLDLTHPVETHIIITNG